MQRSLLSSRAARLAVAVVLLLTGLGCASSPEPAASPSPAAPPICAARVARLWHGKTPNKKADEYTAYISEALPKFRAISGNLGYQLMRETIGDETHFVVISYWASRDAIKAYAGDDIRKTRSLPRDPELLIDLEPTVMNYDLVRADLAGCDHPGL